MNAAGLLRQFSRAGIKLWVEGESLHYAASTKEGVTKELLGELRHHKPELIRLLRSLGGTKADKTPLRKAPHGERIPASFAQERLLFVDRLQGPGTSYNLTSAFRISGPLDITAFRTSVESLVERHESLRTVFAEHDGKFYQRAVDFRPPLPVTDLEALSAEAQATALDEAMAAEAATPFDLMRGPHLRMRLLRLAEASCAFVVCMHHIVSDDASIGVFVDELRQLYAHHTGASAEGPPPLALQYGDVAWCQRHGPAETDALVTFWKQTLALAPPLLSLPLDMPRKPVSAPVGAAVPVPLVPDLSERLDRLQTSLGCTPFHAVLAAYSVSLSKFGGDRDVVIGVPVTGRDDPDTQRLIGPFINMLPIRVELAAVDSLADVVAGVRASVTDALDHGDLPFEHIVQAVQPVRSASHSPIFQAMLAFENTPWGILELPDVTIETLVAEDRSVKYDVTIVIVHRGGRLESFLKYDAALFEQATAERLAALFGRVLDVMTAEPRTLVGNLSALGAEEARRELVEWNDTDASWDCTQDLCSFFEETARARPDAVALVFEEQCLSYDSLNSAANRLAHHLVSLGIGPESVVAVLSHRCPEMLVAVLAVLKAGALYLPLEPELPAERQRFMFEDAGADLLLFTVEPAEPFTGAKASIDVRDQERFSGCSRANPPPRATAANGAYVMYTSGSTGTPKGVVNQRGALLNNLLWMNREWPLGADDVVLYKAPFGFDVSVKEMLWPLMFGARIVVARPGGHRDPLYLHELVSSRRVTVTHLVPTMLEYFLSARSPDAAQSLRMVMCGGEALSPDLRRRFAEAYDATLFHLYGPTEAAIAVTGKLLKRGDGESRVVLGAPMANCQIYVLDDELAPVLGGTPGELCIGGVPVARGYVGRAALTAERFVPDPLGGVPGARLYRTGDIGRHRRDGQLEYAGRADRQVKLRGLRVELGEIEAALRAHPAIREAVVVPAGRGGNARELRAYVVARGQAPDAQELRRFLHARVPSHMVPSSLSFLDALPVSANGKVDVQSLPEPAPEPVAAGPARVTDAMELRLARIWAELLGVESVAIDGNFFELGGHSLLAVDLQRVLKERLSIEVRVTDLFLYPTIRSFANHLRGDAGPSRAVPGSSSEPFEPAREVTDTAIAVVGMAGRFPRAGSVAELWGNLIDGAECISFFDPAEVLRAGVAPALVNHPRFVPARGAVAPLTDFDSALFGMHDREAELLDPQIRLLLECSVEGLDDAGCDPERYQAARQNGVGVFVATSRSAYYLNNLQHRSDVFRAFGPLQIAMATDKSYAATQIAYRLGLEGPAVAVDTACSSGLVAIHQACHSLLSGECDLALAGAASVDVPFVGGYVAEQGNIGSPDGHCRPFESRANGTVRGTGGGVVVLKRHADALADGDRIYALVRGSALNNDGAYKVGFSAPSARGQEAVIRRALRVARVEPERIGYVETHGTGTALGDAVELEALGRVFQNGKVVLGGIKANLGHLDAAAGLAGFIKTSLALHHRVIPPQPDFVQPREELAHESSPFSVNRTAAPWASDHGPLFAGVSSFGIGGTNAHVILESASAAAAPESAPGCELVPLSAASAKALEESVHALEAALERGSCPRLADVAFTLATGRKQRRYRAAFSGATVNEVLEELRAFRSSAVEEAADLAPRLVYLLPGQGLLYAGAAEHLYREDAFFREALDRYAGYLTATGGFDVRGVLCRPAAETDAAEAARTSIAQPALFAYSMSLAECFSRFGVEPDALIGHSLGELTGAAIAGVIERGDAMRLAAVRGRLMEAAPRGAMLAVALPERDASRHVTPPCELAVINAVDQCVVSGPPGPIAELAERLRSEGVHAALLPTSHGFHSAMMEEAAARFGDEFSRVERGVPRVLFTSNVTGAWITPEDAVDPSYWARQIRKPVRYVDQLRTVLEDPECVIVDLSPQQGLSALARRHAAYRAQAVLSAREAAAPYRTTARGLLRAVGALWRRGYPVRWSSVFEARAEKPRRVTLPSYAFQRRRCWLDPSPSPALPDALHAAPVNGHAASPPRVTAAAPAAQARSEAEGVPIEDRVQALWRRALEDRAFALEEDFFGAGGTSLLATQIVSEIELGFNVKISLRRFYEQPTIRFLAQEIAAGGAAPSRENESERQLVEV